ncbi:MAG: hypothetical protein M0R06_14820 [Sphaerochaeta sp.]|jgi:ATP-dependent protease HslVU (ClpYQ) peptidase subunit|nr:hypothetical protein [Sphaerochaeta sp.]
MTTIAARQTKKGVEFAYDTRATWHHNVDGVDKVFTNGEVTFALSGNLRIANLLEHALEVPEFAEKDTDLVKWAVAKLIPAIVACVKEGDATNTKEGSVGLQLQGIFAVRGLCAYLADDGSVVLNSEGLYAVGSGSEFAIGALAHGSSPEEAVAIAARYDSYTGGPIRTLFVPNTKETK